MNEYDGPTLRSIRESVNVPLRRVARLAGMSHGHLSKVERGEHGRPVTPAILAAYERATGARLTDAKQVGVGEELADSSGGWRRGRLSDARRRGFNGHIAAIAAGGPVGEPISKMIDSLGRISTPTRVGVADVAVLEQAAGMLTGVDLRHGGGLVHQSARVMLRWAVGLTTATMTGEIRQWLHVAIGHLAHRAAWAAFDADAHDAARNLLTVALDAAITAKDRDLRARVVADVGAQHNHLGYPNDCVEIISMVEGDQQVSPAVRMVLYGVKARAHAAARQLAEARKHLVLVEHSHAEACGENPAGWQASLLSEARLNAITGHAAATLARRSGEPADTTEAIRRLTAAVDGLDPATHARARALCAARLAILHIDTDQPAEGIGWARQALHTAAEIRSARLMRHLQAVAATANAHPDDPTLKQLAVDMTLLSAPTPSPRPCPHPRRRRWPPQPAERRS